MVVQNYRQIFPPNIVSKITTFCERSELERTGSGSYGSYGRDRGGGVDLLSPPPLLLSDNSDLL